MTDKASETRVLSMILANLHTLPGCMFWRANHGKAQMKGRWVEFGTKGQADILGCAAGKFVAVEVKTETGRQSPEQKEFQSKVEAAGGIYILARTREDAMLPVQRLVQVALL